MIITCNCGEKKFTLPDNSIPVSGRMVQCGYCGLKWKQFPVKAETSKIPPKKVEDPIIKKEASIKKTAKTKITKNKIKKVTKKTGPSLYSPEYLAKKHGIKLNEKKIDQKKPISSGKQISFGFYNSLLLFIVSIIVILRILYFAQEVVIFNFPFTQLYLEHLFETINNIKDIVNNFFY